MNNNSMSYIHYKRNGFMRLLRNCFLWQTDKRYFETFLKSSDSSENPLSD